MTHPYQYRPLEEPDLPRAAWLLAQAFGRDEESCINWLRYAGLEHLRVMARPGAEPDACVLLIDMGIFLSGRSVPQLGVAGVATAPEARGGGIALAMMNDVLRETAARGLGISVLYPALLSLYRRVGYEQAGSRFQVVIDTTRLRPSREDRGPALRPITAEDRPVLERVHRERARFDHGQVDRGPYIWGRVFSPRGEKTQGWLIEEQGEITGWLIHARKSTPTGGPFPECELVISDVQAFTHAAARRVLALLADESTIWRRATFYSGPAHPILVAIPDRMYELRLADYWMVRVTDVAKALEDRGYPVGLSASLGLEVRDELLPACNGRFVMRVEGGRASVSRAHDGEHPSAASARVGPGGPLSWLRLHVRDLAPIYTGFMSARAAMVAGQIQGDEGAHADESALATADAIFGGAAPGMQDQF